MNPSPGFRKFLIVLASIVCVVYLAYRAFFTFNLTTTYAVIASSILYVGELFGIINLLLFFLQVWEVSEPPAKPVLEGRTVDVFIPTYNEDIQLLRATLEAAVRMDYPHRTYVLDDGRRPEVKVLADDLGVIYISRQDNRNAKAGNLNNAFEQTDGEFIVVLDADHVPEPHFITRLIGYFADPKLGYVQTPHAFYNFDSFQARLNPRAKTYWEEGHQFYCVIQPGRNHWNAPIFAGSAAMFRRHALKEVGYIAVETITEDMHTGLRLAAKGWKALAITERLVAGQAAPDITTFHSQRLRWGEGNLSIMAYDNPLFMKGLSLPQRLCYLASMIHWAGGLFKLFIYLTPIMMLFTGVPPVSDFTWTLGIVTGTYLFISLLTLKVVSNGYGSIINSELYSMINFWTQVKATWRSIFKRKNQRFVVTRKRGRQSKQIWTFIRPQVYLILLSVLALFWGWGRLSFDLSKIPYIGTYLGTLGTGVSDDYFKPLIPSIWVVLHIMLAYMVIRRALWPVNRRFSIRHEVNLPVEYEVATMAMSPVKFGITADLNETGMALIAYEKLEPGTVIRMTLRGANEVVKCKAEIRTITRLSKEAGFPGFRYGVQFQNLTPPQIDALNRLCLHFAVPRLYEQYNRGNKESFFRNLTNWRERGMRQRRREARYGYHLPLILNTGTTEETLQYTATEDLSRVATAAIIDQELPPGTPVSYLMSTPLGEVRGTGRAIRSERRQYAGQVYHRATIEFSDFEGQGRNIVQSLANPDQTNTIDPVLRPRKNLPSVNMVGPIFIGLAILIPLLLGLWFFVFKFVHDDDLFLREKISGEISELDAKKIDAIYARTMDESYPSTDRLVLLMKALDKMRNKPDLDRVTTLLGKRDPNNWNLRAALAQSWDNMQKYPEAEREYQYVLDHAEKSGFSDDKKKDLYVAAARSSAHATKFDQAADYFRKALNLNPNDKELRYWYAGALVSTNNAKNLKTAENVLREAPLDTNGRLLLIDVYLKSGKPSDLVLAEQEALTLQKENPNSLEAEQRVADIKAASKQWDKARQLYQTLANKNKEDSELQFKIAQSALASGDVNEAFERYKLLIDKNILEKTLIRQDVLKGYIDTASSAKLIPEEQVPVLMAVYTQVADNPIEDVSYLSRLAWGLQQANKLDEAAIILEGAYKRNKQIEPQFREQYADLLIKRERYPQAAEVVEGLETTQAQRLYVLAKMKSRDFKVAIERAEALAKKEPGNIDNQRLLVNVLADSGDFERAINEMSRYPVAKPEDRVLVDIEKAKLLLWAGSKDEANFNIAAVQLQKLIEPDIDGRIALWPYFINATSSAKIQEPGILDLTKKIAEKMKHSATVEPQVLSRLAWILVRNKQYPLAQPLLDQAMRMNPKDPKIREELAGVMASAERYKDAVTLMTGVKLDDKGHYTMAQLHSGEKDFTTAEFHIKEILKNKPNDREAREMQANIVSWKQEYPQAIPMFEKLRDEYPDEPTYPIRIAEIVLWQKDYDKAMALFAEQFQKYPQDTRIWEGFAKAAAQTRAIPASMQKTAQAIADKVASIPESKNPVLFAATAWMMFKLQNLNLSDSLLARAMEGKIEDPGSRRELARIYYELRRFKEGLKLFDDVPLNEEDRHRKIDFAVQLRYAKVVRDEAEALLKLKPRDFRARGALAYALSLEEKHKEALKIYEDLLNENKGDKVIFRAVADSLLASSYFPQAIEKYETILKEKYEDDDLWLRFIDSAASSPKLETAEQTRLLVQVYDSMMKKDVQDAARYSRLAWACIKHLDDTKRGTDAINRAISLNSKISDIRVEIAGVLANLERLPEALNQFDGLVLSKLNIDHRQLYINLLIAIRPQRLDKAELELRLLLQEKLEEKTHDGVLKLLASVLAWEGKYPESRKIWEEMVRKYPDNPDSKLNLAFVTLWSKQPDEALERFSVFIDKYPEDPKAWVGYVEAVAGASGSRITDAVRQRVMEIYTKAMGFKIRTDEDVQNLASLGSALAKLNKKAEARAAFKKALDFAPTSRIAWKRYGETLYAMGEFDEANRVFTDILTGVRPTSTSVPANDPTRVPR